MYHIGVPLYTPAIPTLLLQCVPPARRGAAMGLDAAVNTLARIGAPLALGALYRARGPARAFEAAGAATAAAAGVALARRALIYRASKE